MRYLKRATINTLVGMFIGVSMVIFVITILLFGNHHISKNSFLLLMSFSFFILGCSGIPIIIRKEIPSFFFQPFQKGEIFTGVFMSALGFIPSLFFLIVLTERLLNFLR